MEGTRGFLSPLSLTSNQLLAKQHQLRYRGHDLKEKLSSTRLLTTELNHDDRHQSIVITTMTLQRLH